MTMNITTWFSENKTTTSLVAAFVVGTGGLGYLTWSAWDDYASATDEYNSKASELDRLSHKPIFPSASNLEKLGDTVSSDQKNLGKLVAALQKYSIPPFGSIEKSKPQDQPQHFQDTLRERVTAIKLLATNSECMLPTSFYLGLDEYENQLPTPEQVPGLSKQLTVLDWLAQMLAEEKGLALIEFSRIRSDASPASPLPAPNAPTFGHRPPPATATATGVTGSSDETVCVTQIALRCDQTEFREIINAISSAPYILVIEDIKIQNTVAEPPRRDVGDSSAQTGSSPDGSAPVQRLPIIVGRESLNAVLRIRALDFPENQHQPEASR